MKFYISFKEEDKHMINGVIYDKDCLALIYGSSGHIIRIVEGYFGDRYNTIYDRWGIEDVDQSRYSRGVLEVNPEEIKTERAEPRAEPRAESRGSSRLERSLSDDIRRNFVENAMVTGGLVEPVEEGDPPTPMPETEGGNNLPLVDNSTYSRGRTDGTISSCSCNNCVRRRIDHDADSRYRNRDITVPMMFNYGTIEEMNHGDRERYIDGLRGFCTPEVRSHLSDVEVLHARLLDVRRNEDQQRIIYTSTPSGTTFNNRWTTGPFGRDTNFSVSDSSEEPDEEPDTRGT